MSQRVTIVDNLLGLANHVISEIPLNSPLPSPEGDLDDPTIGSDGLTALDRLWVGHLKQRGISGYKAYLCCVNGRLKAALTLLDAAREMEEAWENRPLEALAPSVGPLIRIYAPYLAGGTAEIQTIGLAGSIATVGSFAYPETKHALEALCGGLRAIAEGIRKTARKDCLDCVKKGIWKNTNPIRKFTSGTHRHRMGGVAP